MTTIREAAVAGQFYPENKAALSRQVSEYLKKSYTSMLTMDTRILICPHAGYLFSGQIAADAISHLNKNKIKRVFILASAHHFGFHGISVSPQAYKTPIGCVENDIEISNKLLNENFINYIPEAHKNEHCIEVELPILQMHLKTFAIVPILFGACSDHEINLLANELQAYADNPENAFIVSTDFSHYPNYNDAYKLDKLTADAIISGKTECLKQCLQNHENNNIKELKTALCGENAVLCAMKIAKREDYHWEIISYANSGDSLHGNLDAVVGYYAIRAGKLADEFSLSKQEKQKLLSYARAVINHKLTPEKHALPSQKNMPKSLFKPCGAFVTLHKGEKLKGCMGRFSERKALIDSVYEMAISAAFNDPRFKPVKAEEFHEIDIEISALSPLQRINGIDDFILEVHGIYIIKRDDNNQITHSGTFLPQVAASQNWTKAEFLGHCSQDKANIGWDGWKNAELYRYNTLTFSEKKAL